VQLVSVSVRVAAQQAVAGDVLDSAFVVVDFGTLEQTVIEVYVGAPVLRRYPAWRW